MAEIGINVDFGWGFTPEDVLASGTEWVRAILRPDQDPAYLGELAGSGVKILGLMVNEGLPEGMGYREAARYYRDRYSGVLSVVQACNEPDGQPDGSSQVQAAESFLASVYDVATEFGATGVTVIPGAMVSGNPAWLEPIAKELFQVCQGIAIHPYGMRPSADWPASDWGFGTISDALANYRRFGQPFYLTEYGYRRSEMGDSHAHAESVGRAITAIRAEPDVIAAMLFCWSMKMHEDFGILDADGNATESYAAFVGAF